MKLKLLTLNVGLLDYEFLGHVVFSNPIYSNERLKYIPNSIIKENADIVCIQECYKDEHFEFIYSNLKHIYPYYARQDNSRNIFQLHNGLIIFSKWNIENSNLINHKKVDIIEKMFGNKSLLTAYVNIPKIGKVLIANVHLTAGGSNPLSIETILNRNDGIKDILNIVNKCENSNSCVTILMGDFNCGPLFSSQNYFKILKYGYIDTYDYANEKHGPNYTWTTNNSITLQHHDKIKNIHSDRLDHIFIHKNDKQIKKIKKAKILFNEKNIEIDNTTKCSLSYPHGLNIYLKF